jgi:acetolactate synthase-1/2/3 large subunit
LTESQTCSQALAQALNAAGIRYVFGHPGGEIVDLMAALPEHSIEFILTGHESAATYMAATVGRLTGTPGACLATLGPGASNLVLGVGSALLDRDPLLAISARTANLMVHRSNKQNLPLNEMFASITKWSVALEGAGTSRTVQEAVKVATTAPRGPVYMTLASDLGNATERPDDPGPTPPDLPTANDETLDVIATALNAARKPIGVVGIGMQPDRDTPAVRRFFEETGIPYVITCQGKGNADPRGKRFLGHVLPAAGDRPIDAWIEESDCVLGVGFDPVESSKLWHYDAPLHIIADGPVGFGEFQPSVECTGEVGPLMDRLREAYKGSIDWTDAAMDDLRREVLEAIRPDVASTSNGVSPYHLVVELRDILPEDTILSGDVGAHKLVLSQAWLAPQPGTFLMSNGGSSMGHGPASAMAASLIRPEQPVVSVTGDGAFAMMVQELETVRRMGTAPLFVVLCDKSLAIIKIAQKSRDLKPQGVDFMPVDWARVAEGFGVRGETATTMGEVRTKVESWLARREAMVLAVAVDDSLYKGLRY